jgi:hypothetical protein
MFITNKNTSATVVEKLDFCPFDGFQFGGSGSLGDSAPASGEIALHLSRHPEQQTA